VQLPVRARFPGLKNAGVRQMTAHLKSKVPVILMGFNAPALGSVSTKNRWKPYALIVLKTILTGGESAWLPKQLERESGIATHVAIQYRPFARLANPFTIMVVPAKGVSSTTVTSAIWEKINQLKTHLIAQSLLNKVKTQALSHQIMQLDSLSGTAYQIGRVIATGLPITAYTQLVTDVNAVTPAQVNAVAKQVFQSRQLTIGILHPTLQSKPAIKQTNALLQVGEINAVF
jgi:zinc protease